MMIAYSNFQQSPTLLQLRRPSSFSGLQINGRTTLCRKSFITCSNLKNSKDGEDENINETFFISHGRSRLTVQDSKPARKFLESWKEKIYTKKPKAILVISAHWEADHPTVNSVDINDTIFGSFAFPSRIKNFRYPAPGSPNLAKRVQELLTASGFTSVLIDEKHGLDHGAWVPLMFMYPEPDIPVFQLAVQSHLDGLHHYNMGRALAPLKDEGVLIIGSGSATHPADNTPHCNDGVAPWAAGFDHWLETALTNGRYEEVNKCETKAPNWNLAHPLPEHFYPLHVAMGAAGENSKAELIHSSWDHGIMSYSSYKFTSEMCHE